ncbi:hypothetical protein [Burkholderia stagnalis]|uniref:hypothetical protein n=1 Tax=Burkholderia stagnalis TaxID=1503054 RepID=UPI0012D9B5A1|nr:hypothetical protein [Burkholderia stagnalis]
MQIAPGLTACLKKEKSGEIGAAHGRRCRHSGDRVSGLKHFACPGDANLHAGRPARAAARLRENPEKIF